MKFVLPVRNELWMGIASDEKKLSQINVFVSSNTLSLEIESEMSSPSLAKKLLIFF